MANLTEVAQWEAGIYRIETTDPVIGGEDGISNAQAKLLGNRTLYLKQVADDHETRITEVETTSSSAFVMAENALGSATLIRHGIVVAKRQTGSLTAKANFLSLDIVSKTVTLVASATEPFAASIQAGFGSTPGIYYAMTEMNKVITYAVGTDKLLLIEPSGSNGAFSLVLEEWVTPVFSFIEPTSPVSGTYWYDLKRHTTFRHNGTTWSSVTSLPIAKIIPGDEQIVYLAPIGKSVDALYGVCDVPAGTVHTFAGTAGSIPSGYLLCDGGAINRSVYCNLFDAIGTTYGVGNGTTTFNLPDLRGEFIRGFDGGRGIDLNSFSKTSATTNGSAIVTTNATDDLAVGMTVTGTGIPVGATVLSITNSTTFVLNANATATNASVSLTYAGRVFGSWQPATRIQAHVGTQGSQLAVAAQYPDATETYSIPGQTETSFGSSQSFIRNLVRPRNVAMNYIIKF